MKKAIVFLLGFAAVVGAQTPAKPQVGVPPTFIQMSDTQFGMFTANKDFAHETANMEFAIATANRLKPQFVIVTGDLINAGSDAAQAAEYKRIVAKLDPAIKLYSVAGNHDVGNEPTKETLARYRERFGPDYYTFRAGEIEGIVLDSNLEKGAQNVPEEAAKMEAWLKTQLAGAQRAGVKQIIVFQHIPFFLKEANEEDQYFNIPKDVRARYLAMLHQYGVKQVFAGHLHHNAEGKDGDLEMYTTGPVGMPLDGGKSGMRLVIAKDGRVEQKFYDFGELPQ